MRHLEELLGAMPPSRRTALAGLIIAVATLVCYIPAMSAGAVWDDLTITFFGTEYMEHPAGLFTVWESPRMTHFFPVTFASWWLEWQLWGEDLRGYHCTNILLHVAVSLLLWRTLASLEIRGAWLIALVYAVHPVNVSTVAWIAERKNLLAMLFSLLAIRSYLHSEATGSRRSYLACIAFFGLGLLSKSQIVTLPCVLLLLAWWKQGNFGRREILRSVPLFSLSLLLGLATLWVQAERAMGEEVIAPEGLWTRIATGGWAIWFYVSKSLLPINLCMPYPRWHVDAGSFWTWIPLLAGCACLAAAWHWRRLLGKEMFVAVAYFLICLLPVLGIFKWSYLRYSFVADHYLYMAIVGLLALIISTVWRVAEGNRMLMQLATAAGCLTVVLFGAQTWRQAATYENMETWCRHTISVHPGIWVAHANLGQALRERDDLDGAERHFRLAVQYGSHIPQLYLNLGDLLIQEGRLTELHDLYREGCLKNPQSSHLRYNLAAAHLMSEDRVAARSEFLRVLKSNPDHALANEQVGVLLLEEGKSREALPLLQKAAEQEVDRADFAYNLAIALLGCQRADEAMNCLERAVAIDPQHAGAHFELGKLLRVRGKVQEATVCFRQAVAADPGHVSARYQLGRAYALQEQLPEAEIELAKTVELQPSNAEAHHDLAVVLAHQRRFPEALTHLERAAQLEPDNRTYVEKLARAARSLRSSAVER